jgi:O-antigen ligase
MMSVASNAAQGGWAMHRARMVMIADWLAVGVVVTMPWSTSLFQILIVLWLIALLPTLDVAALRRELQTPAGALPVLLWLAGALGMLWANVPWAERIEGLGGFHKLLVIPLLLAQFRRSPRGWYVVSGFLLSCSVLLAASFAGWLLKIGVGGKAPGYPVRDYIAQSTEFMICIFALLAFAVDWCRKTQWRLAAAAGLLSALFLANILLIATGRTALVVIPVLVLLLGYRAWGWKGVVAGCVTASIIGAMAWTVSPFLRHRLTSTFVDVQAYQADNSRGHSAVRIEFWRKSAGFVAEAPVIGHGTGSIRAKFAEAATGQGITRVVAENPHNQVLTVAIQLGMFGAAILMTMWVAHLALFRGGGLVAWIGVVVVVQNVVSSMFNSHLFDAFHGWLYVFAFGVLAGMMLRGEKDPLMKAPP